MVDKEKTFEVARRIDILMKRAEGKEGILLDDWVDLFKEFSSIQLKVQIAISDNLLATQREVKRLREILL